MNNQSETKQELFKENALLKQKIQKLEHSESDRKLAEAALQESEERYRTILEDMDEGYFEFDLTGNFTFYCDDKYRHRRLSR